jgi:hypothetical protein
MSEYLQENRRAVIMLVVALCVAALGGLYLLLSGGGSEEPPPVTRGETPQPAVTVEPVDQSDAIVTTAVVRGANSNPFGPLSGTQTDAVTSSDSSSSDKSKSSQKNSSSSSTKSSSQTSVDVKTTDTTNNTTVDVTGSQTGDETKPEEPKNVVPEPIDSGKDSGDAIPVTLLEVESDYVVARVDSERSKLYIGIPGVDGVTYFAPLGGGCAWLGRTDSEVRVSLCKGKTERL